MFFSEEFSSNKILQAALAVITFNYFIVFYSWIGRSMVSRSSLSDLSYSCPTYFQECDRFYFLTSLPAGYSQTIFYMLLFGVLAWVVYLLTEKQWKQAATVLIVPYLWHLAVVFLLTDNAHANYEYYVIIFATIIIFLPHKEYFTKLAIVLFYFLSTFAKIHPAWIAGSYFTNLQLGLPFFPEWSIPLWTNLVILVEMIGAWFLLSKHPILQRSVLVFFICFHLYSGVFVQYRYPATVLPMLLVMFGPWYRWTPTPLTRRSLVGWGLIALLIFMQLTPKMIYGDEKLTLEGNHYGLYMFEANHQCISIATAYFNTDRQPVEDVRTSYNARSRCNPYGTWFYYGEICEHDPTIERIALTFDHSINGEPFLRIVDTDNVCDLEYKPFSHNEWIKTQADAPIVNGRPAKNNYD